MKVSFLVTYYNQEEYVDKSMQSILKIKKDCDYEILVGDDGSQDGTVEKINKYVKRDPSRIHLYIMERDSEKQYDSVERVSALRAKLLGCVSGDFFCVLDGDDWYSNVDFVNKALEEFKRDDSLSVVAFGYRNVNSKGEEISSYSFPKGKTSKKRFIRKYYTPAGACVFKIIKQEKFLKKIHEYIFYDDNEITLNNLAYGELYFFDDIIYSYRQTETSIFNSLNEFKKCFLNTMGYDAGVYYLPNHKTDVMIRYLYAVLVVYLLRHHITDLISQEEYKKYLEQSMRNKDSFIYMILQFGGFNYGRKHFLYMLKVLLIKPNVLLASIIGARKIWLNFQKCI